MEGQRHDIPIVDVGALRRGAAGPGGEAVARRLGDACRDNGFFYVVGHGVDPVLQQRLRALSAAFFAQDPANRQAIAMARGGRAWRGYFPVGAELTSGRPDRKEGLYFGEELPDDDPRVRAGTPLHGANLFPEHPAALRETVLAYMQALTELGHRLMSGLALALGLRADYFELHATGRPLTLFRIFNYPPPPPGDPDWGVGEHTDYGLLTILLQDDSGGLEVKTRAGWLAAPPVPDTFVCNIGDMLDRMTQGMFRSTPHRVRNPAPHDRLSFPFFFDPDYFARVQPIALPGVPRPVDDGVQRWDGANVHAFEGTYGDYLLNKVGKVFPGLQQAVL